MQSDTRGEGPTLSSGDSVVEFMVHHHWFGKHTRMSKYVSKYITEDIENKFINNQDITWKLCKVFVERNYPGVSGQVKFLDSHECPDCGYLGAVIRYGVGEVIKRTRNFCPCGAARISVPYINVMQPHLTVIETHGKLPISVDNTITDWISSTTLREIIANYKEDGMTVTTIVIESVVPMLSLVKFSKLAKDLGVAIIIVTPNTLPPKEEEEVKKVADTYLTVAGDIVKLKS